MPKFQLVAPFLEIAAVAYSTLIKDADLALARAVLDAAAGGDDTEVKDTGLKQVGFSPTLYQDYTDNGLDEILFAAYDAKTELAIKFRYSTAAIGAANPEYRFSAKVSGFSPISGQHGQFIMTKPNFVISSGSVTRAVA